MLGEERGEINKNTKKKHPNERMLLLTTTSKN